VTEDCKCRGNKMQKTNGEVTNVVQEVKLDGKYLKSNEIG